MPHLLCAHYTVLFFMYVFFFFTASFAENLITLRGPVRCEGMRAYAQARSLPYHRCIINIYAIYVYVYCVFHHMEHLLHEYIVYICICV